MAGALGAQTTWTGDVSSDWNLAGNWTVGVPDPTDDVTIPITSTAPVISATSAVARSVTVQVDAFLAIGASGTLTINGSAMQGILNQGTVENAGTLTIGNISSVGVQGIRNEGAFNNLSGGEIHIDRTSGGESAGIQNGMGSSVSNAGLIAIGASVAAGGYGITNFGTFTNMTGGQLNIDRSTVYGIRQAGTFNNSGSIHIGSVAGGQTMTFGIANSTGPFNNNAGGDIHIDRVFEGLYVFNNTLANAGAITIGELTAVSTLVFDQGTGTFSNQTGGLLAGTGTIHSDRFVAAGGTLSPGYSPGTMTFQGGENFSNALLSIEVNGTGTAGVHYDRVNVTGTATLGGTLQVSINYVPTNGDEVTILTATTVSGTFATVTGLPPHWEVVYTSNTVKLRVDARNTWTGAISMDWNTAGNWTGGIPDATDDVVVPDVTNDPVISTSGAQASTVRIETGAMLTIQPAGILTTHGVTTINGTVTSVYNQGMLQNGGVLNVIDE